MEFNERKKPLQGIRVLDLTRLLAGPYCTMLLADLGAEVIKIEMPGRGDDARAVGPFVNGESTYFISVNRQKKSVVLDLKKERGREVFLRMVKNVDALVENFRGGTMEKLGLGYDRLREINPRLIYAACSGFGHSGPYSHKPAYDIIVQGMGGIMSITGHPGGEPTRVGASIGDIAAGLFTAIGILSALYSRTMGNGGQKIDVAMLDCQVAILENAIAQYGATGKVPGPIGNRHPLIAPFCTLATRDGHIIVAVGNDELWTRFCHILNRVELLYDPRFASNDLRNRHRQELEAILQEVFKAKSTGEWRQLLEDGGIPCGPINTVKEVVNDPQVLAREMIVEVAQPKAGLLKIAGIPIKFSHTPCRVEKPAPLLGEHTEEVLRSFGFSGEEISRLKREKVINGVDSAQA